MKDSKDKIKSIVLNSIKKEKDYHIYILPDNLSKKLRAYASMRKDMEFCREALGELIKILSNKENKRLSTISLWVSIIIIYCKCFTDATTAKNPKLEKDKCFNEKSKHLEELHEQLINLRHNFIAHRGDTDHEHLIAYMLVSKARDERGVFVKSLRATSTKPEKLKLYSELFLHIHNIIENKFNIEGGKLEEYLSKKSPEEIKQYLLV
ncbi:MAG TPA: hypothetical protein VN698_02160 [Bacteroidia bacterium]|nr:hypothetical protein [Bacteroidia bacterium]